MKLRLFSFQVLIFIVSLILAGCGGGDSSPAGSGVNMSGVWEGYIVDTDNDGEPDEYPQEMFFFKIDDQEGALSGQFMAVVNDDYLNSELSGLRTGDKFVITLKVEDYQVVFNGSYSDQDNEPTLWAEWKDSDGEVGQVVFSLNPDMIDLDEETNDPETDASNNDSFLGRNEYKLTYRFGQGPPVVFVHGANSDESLWNEMLNLLETAGLGVHHAIYTYNYPWEEKPVDTARQLRTFIDQAGLQKPILVGGFTGGLVARQYIAAGGAYDRLLTIGTPQEGTFLLRLFQKHAFFWWLYQPGLSDFDIDADFMKVLKENPLDVNTRAGIKAIAGKMSGSWEKKCFLGICYHVWNWHSDYNFYMRVYSSVIKSGTGYVLKNMNKYYGTENDGLVTFYSAHFTNCSDFGCADSRLTWVDCDHQGLFQPRGCSDTYYWLKNDLFQ